MRSIDPIVVANKVWLIFLKVDKGYFRKLALD